MIKLKIAVLTLLKLIYSETSSSTDDFIVPNPRTSFELDFKDKNSANTRFAGFDMVGDIIDPSLPSNPAKVALEGALANASDEITASFNKLKASLAASVANTSVEDSDESCALYEDISDSVSEMVGWLASRLAPLNKALSGFVNLFVQSETATLDSIVQAKAAKVAEMLADPAAPPETADVVEVISSIAVEAKAQFEELSEQEKVTLFKLVKDYNDGIIADAKTQLNDLFNSIDERVALAAETYSEMNADKVAHAFKVFEDALQSIKHDMSEQLSKVVGEFSSSKCKKSEGLDLLESIINGSE